LQVHAAHGYLISQFLSPYTNRRKDKWGGTINNRMRFVNEIYKRTREKVGDYFPLLIKINVNDRMKNGLKSEEGIVMAKEIANIGFDGIEVSCGIQEDGGSTLRGDTPIDVVLDEWDMYKNKVFLFKLFMKKFGIKLMAPLPFTQAYNLEYAKSIKEKVNVPIFAVGGMVDPASMEEAIQSGKADYISMCRALITDPQFSNKIEEGNRAISRCIHCNLCLFYYHTRPLRCYQGKRMKGDRT